MTTLYDYSVFAMFRVYVAVEQIQIYVRKWIHYFRVVTFSHSDDPEVLQAKLDAWMTNADNAAMIRARRAYRVIAGHDLPM